MIDQLRQERGQAESLKKILTNERDALRSRIMNIELANGKGTAAAEEEFKKPHAVAESNDKITENEDEKLKRKKKNKKKKKKKADEDDLFLDEVLKQTG